KIVPMLSVLFFNSVQKLNSSSPIANCLTRMLYLVRSSQALEEKVVMMCLLTISSDNPLLLNTLMADDGVVFQHSYIFSSRLRDLISCSSSSQMYEEGCTERYITVCSYFHR